MAGGRGSRQDEIVTEWLGINPQTFSVERVSEWRSGKLTKSRPNGTSYTHSMSSGRHAENEIVIVFGLLELRSYPVHLWNTDTPKRIQADLEEAAARMKAERKDGA